MKKYNVPEIKKDIYYVGVKDDGRRMFDALIPLPTGTSYNSYLVKSDKTALIDSVNPGFERELTGRIDEIIPSSRLDYVVMNHAEPDHAGAIPHLAGTSPGAIFLMTAKGAKMAQRFYGLPEARIKVVKDGDSVSLGRKTLKFIEAPWLHWPETMFTYMPEENILFPCDFFGAHTAMGLYEDEVDDILPLAKRYFGEIMMPFKNQGKKGLEKISGLKIEMIAPSHGPVWRNPSAILEEYRKWTAGQSRKKAVLAFVSMWNSTETMIKAMAETLKSKGVEAVVFNIATSDIGDLAKELVDARAVVLGTPTVLGGMHPMAIYAASLLKAIQPPVKYAALLSSNGWGGGALRHAGELLAPLKLEVAGAHEITGPPTEEDLAKVRQIGEALAARING